MNTPVPLPGRLKWHARRALLELDLVLERFWQRQADLPLEDAQARLLEELLLLEDHDLWDMLCGRLDVLDPRWKPRIETLMQV